MANHNNVSVNRFTGSTITGTVEASRNQLNLHNNQLSNAGIGVNIEANYSMHPGGSSLRDSLHVIRDNQITDFGSPGAAACGIQVQNCNASCIRENFIVNGLTHNNILYGVSIRYAGGTCLSKNTLSLSGTSSVYGIYGSYDGGGAVRPVVESIDSNQLINCSVSGTSGNFFGVSISGGTAGAVWNWIRIERILGTEIWGQPPNSSLNSEAVPRSLSPNPTTPQPWTA